MNAIVTSIRATTVTAVLPQQPRNITIAADATITTAISLSINVTIVVC